MKYRRGEENTTDYKSRHTAEHTDNNSEGNTLFVNAIIDADLPDAVTLNMMKKETNEDDVMTKLKYCILKKGYIPTNVPELQPYQRVFGELSVAKQLVLRGTRIVILNSLRADVIALAHEGHQAITKMKAYLRSRVWFPTMDSLIDNFVRSCLACQATTPQQRYEPLTLAPIPEGPWQQLAMDFKGLGLWLETWLNTNHSPNPNPRGVRKCQ